MRKLLTGIIIITLFLSGFQVKSQLEPIQWQRTHIADNALKEAAFQVLQTKCNTCHIRKNPRRIFSPLNMEELAPRIHQQVFVKQRMPKGKDNALTPEESDILKNWLSSQKIN